MSQDSKFLELIEENYQIVQQHLDDPTESKRFSRMLEELEELKRGVVKGTLVRDLFTLPTMQMLDRNDPEDLIESTRAVFFFYRDHYRNLQG